MSLKTAENVESFTESEYTNAQSELSKFFVCRTNRNKNIHLHHCRQLQRDVGSSVSEKSPAVYPYGYHDVCSYCIHDWRNGEIDTSE